MVYPIRNLHITISSLKVNNIPYAEISERRHVFLNTNIKRRLEIFSDMRLPKVFQRLSKAAMLKNLSRPLILVALSDFP